MNERTRIQIENIYNNTNQIFLIYTFLRLLELTDRKNTKEYNSGLEILQLAINEEESLYYYFIKNPSEIIYLVRIIIEDTLYLSGFNNIDLIIMQNQEDLIITRIKQKINQRIAKVEYDPYFNEIIYGTYNLDDYIEVLNNSTDIQMTNFLENAIKNETDKVVKNYLIGAKLYLSFLNEKVEQRNFRNNFNQLPNTFDQELEFQTPDSDKLIDMKNLYGERLILQAFDELCVYDDKDLISPLVQGKSKIYNGLVQTSLLYFSDDYLQNIKFDLAEEIEEYRAMADYSFEQHSFVEKIIYNAFDSIDDIKRNANSDLPKEKNL